MKVKEGSIVDFLAISWNEPQWEFDHPTVVLFPVIKYSPNGNSSENMIEDLAIDLSCGDDVEDEKVSEEFKWRGWKLSTLKKVARERLAGKDTWKSKIRDVLYKKIRFVSDEYGDLTFEIIESKKT